VADTHGSPPSSIEWLHVKQSPQEGFDLPAVGNPFAPARRPRSSANRPKFAVPDHAPDKDFNPVAGVFLDDLCRFPAEAHGLLVRRMAIRQRGLRPWPGAYECSPQPGRYGQLRRWSRSGRPDPRFAQPD
jgi:hypothetical protein